MTTSTAQAGERTAEGGMDYAVLARLHCPYCGSGLEPQERGGGQDSVNLGVVQCACHEYPVVEGIPIVQQRDGLATIVDAAKRGERQEALLCAFRVFRMDWAHRTRWQRFRYELNVRKLLSSPDASFEEALIWIRQPQPFAEYLLHRYANPSLLGSIAAMLALQSVPGGAAAPRLLDLACGTGHSSFLLGHLFPGWEIVSADQDFANLYLTRRFMAPGTIPVCMDAEVPSPFATAGFDAVFCLDAFHYLHSKRAVAAELRRVVKPEGTWLFPHLHNRLGSNPVAGVPLSPQAYLDCFALPHARLFSELEMMQRLSREGVADCTEVRPPQALDACHAVTLIAGPARVWAVHRGFPGLLARRREALALNPIYEARWNGKHLDTVMRWPSYGLRQECLEAETVLPSTYRISAEQMEALAPENGGDAPLREAISRFVLVPLPPRYRRAGAAAVRQRSVN